MDHVGIVLLPENLNSYKVFWQIKKQSHSISRCRVKYQWSLAQYLQKPSVAKIRVTVEAAISRRSFLQSFNRSQDRERESYLSFSLIGWNGYVLFFKHTSCSFPLLLVSFIALKLMFLFQWEDKEGVECHECSLKLTQNCDRVEIWDALNLRINERINWGTQDLWDNRFVCRLHAT